MTFQSLPKQAGPAIKPEQIQTLNTDLLQKNVSCSFFSRQTTSLLERSTPFIMEPVMIGVKAMKLYVGIDLGTSTMKLLLMDAEGKILNTVTKNYPLEFPQSGWSQQNPEDGRKAL